MALLQAAAAAMEEQYQQLDVLLKALRQATVRWGDPRICLKSMQHPCKRGFRGRRRRPVGLCSTHYGAFGKLAHACERSKAQRGPRWYEATYCRLSTESVYNPVGNGAFGWEMMDVV